MEARCLLIARDLSLPAASREQAIRQTAIQRAATGPGCFFTDPEYRHSAQLKQRMLGHLCTNTPVRDPELLVFMLGSHAPLADRPDMIEVSDHALADSLLKQDARVTLAVCTDLPWQRELALLAHPEPGAVLLRQHPSLFLHAPAQLRTVPALSSILSGMLEKKRDRLLGYIAREDLQLALSLVTRQELVRAIPWILLKLPEAGDFDELCSIAVARDFSQLPALKTRTDAAHYQTLCDLALKVSGRALGCMDPCDRTPERVDRAVRHRDAPHIADIPDELRTEERLRHAVENHAARDYHTRQPQLDPAGWKRLNLWETLKEKREWLAWLPDTERTEALCAEYVAQRPAHACAPEVPIDIQRRHPEWGARAWQGHSTLSMDDQTGPLGKGLQLAPDPVAAIGDNSAILHGYGRWPSIEKIPPWALLVEGFWDQLPQQYKEKIWRNGGTEGLGEAFGVPPFAVEPQALLDPIQEHHCTLRAAALPGQVARQLMFCHHFRLRHQRLGVQLRQAMLDQADSLEVSIKAGDRPLWLMGGAACAAGWTACGGRTLVHTDSRGRVVHAKFQRRGESLASFAAEQAVQQFAQSHESLGWQSEIPEPEGIFRVPLDQIPVDRQDFPDPLQVYKDKGGAYCLAFRFTTRDQDYDTLAWHPDQPGGDCRKAKEGLLRAFHDLGLWSSLGVVHTSTIRLYHHFLATEGSRPELLLSNLFRPDATCYPGTLHLWNTQAIAQSDWGWSGLRDLGDLEFYPFVTAYTGSVDANWVPDGYGQRASFVNGMAQNMLGGLLHYLCACREQADYHYHNEVQVTRLADFLEAACERYLGALLGEDIRLETVFPAGVYAQWRFLAAREMIYWTARQTLTPPEGKEGFAQHFNQDGRPSAELYPGHPRLETVHYGRGGHFTEEAGDNLGANNGKLPLLYLVRGLYMMAARVADRLGVPDAPSS